MANEYKFAHEKDGEIFLTTAKHFVRAQGRSIRFNDEQPTLDSVYCNVFPQDKLKFLNMDIRITALW